MELFRTCKGLTTGSPHSVYLAVLCVFYAIYTLNNIGPRLDFQLGAAGVDRRFPALTSTPHAELKALMNIVLQQHLGRFGLTEEAADNSVGQTRQHLQT